MLSLCGGDDCKCGYCHLCYWAGMPTNYDPLFFPCGDPMWGIQLPSATPDGKPCTSTTGYLNIGVTGTWWSFSPGPLTEPPMFPPPVFFDFIVNGVANHIYSFDPASGNPIRFNPGTPTLSGNRGPDGALIYESEWGVTSQIGLSCLQLASAANPYKDHTYDPAGGVAVYPYTGPRPDPGSSMSWGFNSTGGSQFSVRTTAITGTQAFGYRIMVDRPTCTKVQPRSFLYTPSSEESWFHRLAYHDLC
jgi:hypothetical protein